MDQILTPEGELLRDPPIRDDLIVRLYRAMVFARQYDHKSVSLQRQGRLATYAPFEGQEAAQIGAAAALHPDDWLVATYRDAAAMWAHGYPMDLLYLGRTGDERGGAPPEDVPCLPPSITVGGHMIHAVGISWAAKLRGERNVALTMFGDGATSEGDFHEAMNFAAVYQTPTVFLCQNNGYAISLPVHEQTKAEHISDKAIGYGMPGETIDGNDLLVVYERVLAAVNRARTGGGPTLIEAVTYRMGPHTTNDDPGRYRSSAEEAEARAKDPLERIRRYLESKNAWTEEWEAEVRAEAASAADEAIAAAESVPKPTADDLFGAVFADAPPHIAEQWGWVSHE
ncbi:MAG: pyruvate dehydrogenase (acetyl-transferring) E1 component subunit alpha [Acidimicrobiia bacterium]|nr:MAG: pyruvate dehydrogenase (acetyl-transferring) E1 component subunit alpha [Acidimicrobiia bacterium]